MGGLEQGGGGGKLLPQQAVLFAAVVRVQLFQFGLYVGEPGLEVGFAQFRHGFEQVAEAVGGGEVLLQEGLVFVVAADGGSVCAEGGDVADEGIVDFQQLEAV